MVYRWSRLAYHVNTARGILLRTLRIPSNNYTATFTLERVYIWTKFRNVTKLIARHQCENAIYGTRVYPDQVHGDYKRVVASKPAMSIRSF